MGQASPFKPIALVVEDDVLQRELAVVLLEECEMGCGFRRMRTVIPIECGQRSDRSRTAFR